MEHRKRSHFQQSEPVIIVTEASDSVFGQTPLPRSQTNASHADEYPHRQSHRVVQSPSSYSGRKRSRANSTSTSMLSMIVVSKVSRLRKRIFVFLERPRSRPSEVYHAAVSLLLIASAILTIFTSIPVHAGEVDPTAVFGLEVFIMVVMNVEYLIRICCATAFATKYRGFWGFCRFVRRPVRILDMVIAGCSIAIVVVTAPDHGLELYGEALVSGVRILSIIRLLRLDRYLGGGNLILYFFEIHWRNMAVVYYFTLLIVLVFSLIMYSVEEPYQPEKFANAPRALYWAIVTVSLTGYGDVTPISSTGRVIVMFLIAFGILFAAIAPGLFASTLALKSRNRRGFEREHNRLRDEAARVIQLTWMIRLLQKRKTRLRSSIIPSKPSMEKFTLQPAVHDEEYENDSSMFVRQYSRGPELKPAAEEIMHHRLAHWCILVMRRHCAILRFRTAKNPRGVDFEDNYSLTTLIAADLRGSCDHFDRNFARLTLITELRADTVFGDKVLDEILRKLHLMHMDRGFTSTVELSLSALQRELTLQRQTPDQTPRAPSSSRLMTRENSHNLLNETLL